MTGGAEEGGGEEGIGKRGSPSFKMIDKEYISRLKPLLTFLGNLRAAKISNGGPRSVVAA
jgi:hypothetical protein